MSEVNKIANYNQMMSWLTRPEPPKTQVASAETDALKEQFNEELGPGTIKTLDELPPIQDPFKNFENRNPRETAAQGGVIGEGGMFRGQDMGTREGFASPEAVEYLKTLEPGTTVNTYEIGKKFNIAPATVRGQVERNFPNLKLQTREEGAAKAKETRRAQYAEKTSDVPIIQSEVKGKGAEARTKGRNITGVTFPNKELENKYIKYMEDRYSDVKGRKGPSNKQLATEFYGDATEANIAKIEKINQFYKKNLDLKFEKAPVSEVKEKRKRRLSITQGGKTFKGTDQIPFHHIMPIGGEVDLTTKDVAFIDKLMNSKLAPYNTKLNDIADAISNQLNSQEPGYLDRIDELNKNAEQIIESVKVKLPKKYQNYIGFNRLDPITDEYGTPLRMNVTRVGVDDSKSLAGKKGTPQKLETFTQKSLVSQLANKNNLPPEMVAEDLTNVQKLFRKMQNQMNSGMDPKFLAEYLGAEVKDIAAFGKKYGGDALRKVTNVPIKGLAGIDLPIFQTMFASMYDLEQDSPVWLTLPAAFTDEVANVFKLYDKSTGKYGLGKAKDFGKFLASSLVPQKILGKAVRNPLFKAVTKVGKMGSMAAPILEVGKQAYLSEKRKGMLPEIARQFDIPIEEARRGYDNYVKQGQIRGMQSMVDDTEIPEMSQQGQDNLNSNINAFKQLGSLAGVTEDPYAEKESIYTRGKENPMSLDRALYPDRQNFRDAGKVFKVISAGKKGLDYLKDFLKKKTITVKRGESGTEGASSSFSDPDYKGKYYTPEGGGFGTAAEDARYYSKLGGDEADPKVFTAELTPEEIEEGLRLRALDSKDPEIGDIILPKSAEDKVKIDYLNTIRAKVEKYFNMAEGGRVNFADGPKDPSKKGLGSLSKRNFLKMLTLIPAGILAIRGGPNVLNKAKKATTAVTKTFEGAPAYFINLYKKIKGLGKDVTPGQSTQDRQVVTEFEDYILTEDVATGRTTIERTKIDGDNQYYDENLAEQTYMDFIPGAGQVDETTGKVKIPNEYVEDTSYLRTSGPQKGDIYDTVEGVPDEVIQDGTMFEDDFLDFQPKKKK